VLNFSTRQGTYPLCLPVEQLTNGDS
jgi:hypothetical protein